MNFRKMALARILVDGDQELLLSLTENNFYDLKSRKLYGWSKAYYNKYKKLPTVEALSSTITAQLADKGTIYTAYLESVESVTTSGTTTEEIVDGIRQESAVAQIDNSVKLLVQAAEDKDLDKVKTLTADIARISSMDAAVTPVPIQDLEIISEQTKILEPFLPSIARKGLGFAGVNLISAASGGGKSIFALNQAIHSYRKHNADILYLNIEIPAQDQLLRTVSHITGIPFGSIYNTDLTEDELKELNKVKNDFFNQDNKFKMVNTSLDEETIVNLILNEISTGLDLVVLDYIQLVENTNDYIKSWEFLQKLVKRLHQLALKHKVVILTPIQINTAEVDVETNSIDITTRGSRELEFTSTNWLHIHTGPEEREEGVCRIFTVKARNAEKCTYITKTEFEKMTFVDTGITM